MSGTALSFVNDDGHLCAQCVGIGVAEVAQQAICQLELNMSPLTADGHLRRQPHRLVAARCTCCVAVLQLCQPSSE